ncbi:PhnE/PtxC family ABC transporter permease [Peribacillus cavernae]|uniref:PhnE/PtxC family ABC transporter permease n=1 Tax=Peribacillus cavernae TaxID=1674310 RepID=UPI001FE3D37F|nr:ABC transporter permease subunit [Peribacillus cavernae]MDQ0219887.1 phosphonate transport system permease protein [Peribacillus cavernae]
MKQLLSPLYLHKRLSLTLVLLAAFIWSLFSVTWSRDLLHAGGWATTVQILEGLIKPDLSPDILELAVESSWVTVVYAVTGMTVALIIAFVLGVLGSGVLVSSRPVRIVTAGFSRAVLAIIRAIHELVWALLFVAVIGLSPYAAIFALGIPYGGILGRIFADMLNDVPGEPIQALRAAGASRLHCLMYGYLPLIRSNMISYTMYRFECSIRSSAIMSFVGLGGLGYQIQLSLADLHYDEVWTFLFFLIAIVVLIDAWSNSLRKRLVL